MQVSFTYQKNTNAFIKNLEFQMVQFAKELANLKSWAFSSNTQTNPKKQCKVVTTTSGVVGRNVSGEREN